MAKTPAFTPPKDMGGKLFTKTLGGMFKMENKGPADILKNTKFRKIAKATGHYDYLKEKAASDVARIPAKRAEKIIRAFQEAARGEDRPKGLKIDVKNVHHRTARGVYTEGAKRFRDRLRAERKQEVGREKEAELYAFEQSRYGTSIPGRRGRAKERRSGASEKAKAFRAPGSQRQQAQQRISEITKQTEQNQNNEIRTSALEGDKGRTSSLEGQSPGNQEQSFPEGNEPEVHRSIEVPSEEKTPEKRSQGSASETPQPVQSEEPDIDENLPF